MVTTPNEDTTHVEQSQAGKEVPINVAMDNADISKNEPLSFSVAAGGTLTPTAAQLQLNGVIKLTGAPAADFNLELDDDSDGRNLVRSFVNESGKTVTIDTITGVTAASSVIILLDRESATISMQGKELRALTRLKKTVHLDLSLAGLREITSNDIPNTAATPSGGLLTSDTGPSYARVNGATDKALRVSWALGVVDEVQFPPVAMPHDLDAGEDLTIHLLAKMSDVNDTPTIDVQVFDAIGDTEMGGATAALSDTLAELTVTVANANISGHPLGFLNISLVPGAHAADVLELYAAWIEYIKVLA